MTATTIRLEGIPETMLWTLHNRAQEAKRPNGILRDPDAIRVYDSIPYEYSRYFGRPDGTHASRSRIFDDALRPWLAKHPGGAVVELACGLETQFHRCDEGTVRWYCVDVPEAIAVRERFLPAQARCRHLPLSALDLSWMDEVDPSRGLFVTAQGLLMYFHEAEVRRLVTAILAGFPGAVLMFDVIPPWFSRLTLAGFWKTQHYQAPPMPWGILRGEIEPTLRAWSPAVREVALTSFGDLRGLRGRLLPFMARTPVLRDLLPCIVTVRT